MADKLIQAPLYKLKEDDEVVVLWDNEMKPARLVKVGVGPNKMFVDVKIDGELREIYFQHVWLVNSDKS